MTIVEQILINAFPFLMLQSFAGLRPIRAADDFDDTAATVSRLCPRLAQELSRQRVAIVRHAEKSRYIAMTPLAVKRPTILVDYNVALLEAGAEDFIIAHELAHIERRDALKGHGVMSVLLAAMPASAFVLASWLGGAIGVFAGVATIGLETITIYSLIDAPMRFRRETRADRYAADMLGEDSAIQGLQSLRNVLARVFSKRCIATS